MGTDNNDAIIASTRSLGDHVGGRTNLRRRVHEHADRHAAGRELNTDVEGRPNDGNGGPGAAECDRADCKSFSRLLCRKTFLPNRGKRLGS